MYVIHGPYEYFPEIVELKIGSVLLYNTVQDLESFG
jgi:hypothetical protein